MQSIIINNSEAFYTYVYNLMKKYEKNNPKNDKEIRKNDKEIKNYLKTRRGIIIKNQIYMIN